MNRPSLTEAPQLIQFQTSLRGSVTTSETDPIERQRLRDLEELRRERTGARQRAVERLFTAAGAPERYRAATFGNFEAQTDEHRRALATCERWASGFAKVLDAGASLVLWGPPGTGKTHLVTALLREVLRSDFTAAFMTEASLLRQMRRAFGRDAEVTETETIDAFKSPDLLVIDEAGRSMGNPETRRAMLHEVVDVRYGACKPMVLTSNLSPEALRDHYGAPAWDRLTEGRSLVLSLGGASHRQRRA